MHSGPWATLLKAARFAAVRHRDQRRKDLAQSPYINHPIAVAEILADAGGVEDLHLLVAALLHDTVEDTATSLQEIRAEFGREVAELVDQLTDDKSLPRDERKRRQVEHAPHMSPAARQLKIADKISNLRDLDAESPAGWDRRRKQQYLRWAQDVVDGCRGTNAALERLFDATCQAVERRI